MPPRCATTRAVADQARRAFPLLPRHAVHCCRRKDTNFNLILSNIIYVCAYLEKPRMLSSAAGIARFVPPLSSVQWETAAMPAATRLDSTFRAFRAWLRRAKNRTLFRDRGISRDVSSRSPRCLAPAFFSNERKKKEPRARPAFRQRHHRFQLRSYLSGQPPDRQRKELADS